MTSSVTDRSAGGSSLEESSRSSGLLGSIDERSGGPNEADLVSKVNDNMIIW